MSTIDVDDLVASLASSCHIGQEARELAALQAQLAQTLYHFPPATGDKSHTHGHPHNSVAIPFAYAPSNTPTLSPVSGGGWPEETRRRSRRTTGPGERTIEEEDETMDSPDPRHKHHTDSATSYYGHSARQQQQQHAALHQQQHRSHYDISQSTFTTSDPFYIAQLDASRQIPSSFFPPPPKSSAFYPQTTHIDARSFYVASYPQKDLARR